VPDRHCVGVIVAAQGVRGQVRVKSFTEVPTDVGAYGPLEDESGQRRFEIEVVGSAKGVVIARLGGVKDRTAAETLKGTRLFVHRAQLPASGEDEFLVADLVGLAAFSPHAVPLGKVVAAHDFGAGTVLEIRGENGTEILVPFTRAAVPVVDVGAGRLVIEPPVFAPDDEGEDADVPGDGADPVPRNVSRSAGSVAGRARSGRRRVGPGGD